MAGVKEGEAKISSISSPDKRTLTGWKVGSLLATALFNNGDWLKRAAAARAGFPHDAAEPCIP